MPISDFLGEVSNPLAGGYGDVANPSGGLIGFLSNVLRFIAIAGGLWSLVNMVIAGFTYISAGHDPKQTVLAWQKIYMSLIGLVVIVASYAIAALLGFLLFDNPSAILNPQIYGPGE
jgi:hypothetical protein